MPVILLTNHYSKSILKIVEKELPPNFNLISLKNACKKELLEKAHMADYFLASGRLKIDKDVIEKATHLKMIQRTGVGTDTLDLVRLQEKNIPIYVNRGVNSSSVAEHTIMLILSVLRRLTSVNSSVKQGIWLKQELGVQCNELRNKTVGLIGLGNIGRSVARMLQPFGVNLLYNKRTKLTDDEEKILNIKFRSLHELYKEVDILSLHLPFTKEKEKMIGYNEISSMKSGVIIINTSRGRLIDEDALIHFLKSKHIRGAGLDVFSEEPISRKNPLLGLESVILTPHIGGVTFEAFQQMMRSAMQNIRLFEEGHIEELRNKKLKI